MNTPHKHAELIHAWADGAEIEFLDCDESKWLRCSRPAWDPETEYRIKPQIEKRRYRVGLFVDSIGPRTITADSHQVHGVIERDPSFHSWLTDWVEYEIEVAP